MSLKTLVAITLVISAGAINLACQKNEGRKDSEPTPNPDSVSVNWTVEPKENSGDDNLDLAQMIQAKKALSFKDLSQRTLQKHVKAYASQNNQTANLEEIQKFIQDSMSDVSSINPAKMKIHYEAKIEKALGQEIQYNLDAVTLTHALKVSRLQCYSGTSLHVMMARELGPQKYRELAPIVIFEPGHVLPGYIVKKADKNLVIGVETTVAGAGVVNFGEVKSLSKNTLIIDAESFLIFELIKDTINNPEQIRDQIIKEAAAKFGVEKVEESLSVFTQNSDPQGNQKFNSTHFAFGKAQLAPGDQKRARSRSGTSYLPNSLSGNSSGVLEFEPEVKNDGPELTTMPVGHQQTARVIELNDSSEIQSAFIILERKSHYQYTALHNASCEEAISNEVHFDHQNKRLILEQNPYSRYATPKINFFSSSPKIQGRPVRLYVLNGESNQPYLLVKFVSEDQYYSRGIMIQLCQPIKIEAEIMNVIELKEHLWPTKKGTTIVTGDEDVRLPRENYDHLNMLLNVENDTMRIVESQARTGGGPVPLGRFGLWGQWKKKDAQGNWVVHQNSFKCEMRTWCEVTQFPRLRIEIEKANQKVTAYLLYEKADDQFVIGLASANVESLVNERTLRFTSANKDVVSSLSISRYRSTKLYRMTINSIVTNHQNYVDYFVSPEQLGMTNN